MSQVSKIISFAMSKLGSNEYHGYCQRFVREAYEAGTGKPSEYVFSAGDACRKWMKSGTAKDLNPPRGAACYFVGTPVDGLLYGHVALSAGNGTIYDPVATVRKVKLKSDIHGGYLGWGWQGGEKPDGAEVVTSSSSGTTSNISNSGAISSASMTYDSDDSEIDKTVEITTVTVKNETGALSAKSDSSVGTFTENCDIFLLIQGENCIYRPLITGNIKVSRERTGAPGKMTFSYIDADGINVSEGNAVAFRYKGEKVFYGYIFTFEHDSDREEMNVVCYDQLRYFKNKDNFVYNAKYSDMLKNNICKKYGYNMGIIEDTGYKIPTRLEDGTLFDICDTARSLTHLSNGKWFILYDDFGSICLRSMDNMYLPILLDKDTTGKWTVKSTIDSNAYNRIVLRKDNTKTGERELYVANGSDTQKDWGVLTYEEDADENSSVSALKAKTKALLKYYNRPYRTFRVADCLGDCSVRGGSILAVDMDVGNGKKINNLMIVNKVEHTFSDCLHTMDIDLFGGDFSA